ncbi:hypothetical protein [Streptomyces xanthophaeus]
MSTMSQIITALVVAVIGAAVILIAQRRRFDREDVGPILQFTRDTVALINEGRSGSPDTVTELLEQLATFRIRPARALKGPLAQVREPLKDYKASMYRSQGAGVSASDADHFLDEAATPLRDALKLLHEAAEEFRRTR